VDVTEDAQRVELRRSYATNLFRLMLLQVLLADGVFIADAWAGKAWDVRTSAMQAWLAAAVVQIIGIVYVVTRHLFPNRDAV
jgi:hypothetical protein